MLISRERCLALLSVPGGDHRLALGDDGDLFAAPDRRYPVIDGTPILVDFEDSVLDREHVLRSAAASSVQRPRHGAVASFLKRLVSPEIGANARPLQRIVQELKSSEEARLLVVGGATIGKGLGAIYDDPEIEVVAFDLYASPFVQFVADAHRIPLPSASMDAVVIQAVLEHVVDPARVVAEIWRVLKPGGLVLAETAFMQQVHEGPYDFTRFTEGGHRYLFRRFEAIQSGANGGPGLAFMWSVDYLARGLFRSRTMGRVFKLLFFWVQYLDYLVPGSLAVDAASGVYFLGRKAESEITPQAIVSRYRRIRNGSCDIASDR